MDKWGIHLHIESFYIIETVYDVDIRKELFSGQFSYTVFCRVQAAASIGFFS